MHLVTTVYCAAFTALLCGSDVRSVTSSGYCTAFAERRTLWFLPECTLSFSRDLLYGGDMGF